MRIGRIAAPVIAEARATENEAQRAWHELLRTIGHLAPEGSARVTIGGDQTFANLRVIQVKMETIRLKRPNGNDFVATIPVDRATEYRLTPEGWQLPDWA